MARNEKRKLSIPLQPGIATEVFRRCLTEPFARAFDVEVDTPARTESFLDDVRKDVELGRRSFDVVEWRQQLFTQAKAFGLCEPLDYADMPNTSDMYPRYLDPDGFGVGVFVYGMTIVYNPKKVRRPPKRWADLWSPEFRGMLALRNEFAAGYLMFVVCKAFGIASKDLKNDAVFERAWVRLAELVKQVKVWARSEAHVQEIMARGEAGIAEQFIDVAQIQKDRGVDIEVVFPEEGPIWDHRSWTVVKGTREPELARAFIDFAQAPEQQKSLCETFYGHPVNRKVRLNDALARRIYGRLGTDADIELFTWDWYHSRPDIEDRWRHLIAPG